MALTQSIHKYLTPSTFEDIIERVKKVEGERIRAGNN
jgi:hypothetical protein